MLSSWVTTFFQFVQSLHSFLPVWFRCPYFAANLSTKHIASSPIAAKQQPLRYEQKFLSDIRNMCPVVEYTEQEQLKIQERQLLHQQAGMNVKDALQFAENETFAEKYAYLNKCTVIEYTPLGNVLMLYDAQNEKFVYYSDASMPYRYLETVARKYVKQYRCRPIYIDMLEEWQQLKETKQQEIVAAALTATTQQIAGALHKPIFAKFKSYNTEAGVGRVVTGASSNNNNNPRPISTRSNEILKQQANRYSYEGKIANFSFLQKVPRTKMDHKYALSYQTFKTQLALPRSQM